MDYGYVIKLSSRRVYKEIQLSTDVQIMRIGMGISCDVRLYKEEFFDSFQLDLKRINGRWQIVCSDNIYIDDGDVRKLVTKLLEHGDMFTIKYHDSDQEVTTVEFLYDFDNSKKSYDRIINVSNINTVRIGSSKNNDIILSSQYVQNDSIALHQQNGCLVLLINHCNCGVYHNGRRAQNKEIINNGDFISIANFSFYYKDGKLMTEATSQLSTNIHYNDLVTSNEYPRFIRNTRIRTKICDEKIEVLDPPNKPQKPKNNLFTRLLPSIAMIAVGAATAMTNPFMLISSVVGIVTAVISVVQSKKDFKDNSAERIKKYNAYIENKEKEIKAYRQEEKALVNGIYIETNKEIENVIQFSSDLFDRASSDDDFLNIRLGIGDVEAKREVEYKKQEKLEVEDDLQEKPKELYEKYKYIQQCPVVVDLKETNAIGIIGKEHNRFNLMKNIIVDICSRQFHSDVKLFFVAESKNKEKVQWLRMLPHAFNDTIDANNVVCNDESRNLVFEFLYKELSLREGNKQYSTRFVIFLYDEYGFKNHPISKFVKDAKDIGVTFIFFAENRAQIGLGCDYLIDIKTEEKAQLIYVHDRNESTDFSYRCISDASAKQMVDILAPVYAEEISLESSLTKNISLFKLLNIMSVDDIDLLTNWDKSQVYNTMAAPIGVSKSGIVALDLHDKAHGPHGLVAGTTGSGKSEILQTYILSMAVLFHPYEVAFVIIDFKGGGMANQFRKLPHLVGAITNTDGKEIDRSLKSIKAELQKRQCLFAEVDVNHIDKYNKKYKSGEATTPLPHLIIIVDEFAELKAEQPEFMKELISAARIGRSLGVHLILATQKPSGQVDEQIWSNSRFKLCLKVQDQHDSNEVIKSPLAAEIKEPGRAYLQVGNNEIFELFQSAYSGESEKSDNTSFKEFTIFAITDSGRRIPVYAQVKKKSEDNNRNQLDAIVSYVEAYTKKANILKLPDICLPSLQKSIDYMDSQLNSFSVPIGIYDDPDKQLQDVYGINIFSENTLIVGSSLSGKTNLLQVIIRGIANKYSPDEVSIYIIDFASMVLRHFEGLNHVGGVVVQNEDEKLKNLFKLLSEEIEKRKEKLLLAGVSNYLSYKEAGNDDLAQIVLMVDNLTALKELYFAEDDFLLPICRDGISVGISVIISNSQCSGVGYKYYSSINQRIGLFCSDTSEYHTLFEHCRIQPDNTPGRCLIQYEKSILESQTFLAFKGDKEHERVSHIGEFIREKNDIWTTKAPRIPIIPDILLDSMIKEEFGISSDTNNLLLGLDFANVLPVCIDFQNQDVIAISGNNYDSRVNFNTYLRKSLLNLNVDLYVLDDYSGSFEELATSNNIKLFSKNVSDIGEMISDIKGKLVQRNSEREINGALVLDQMKPLVFIINNAEALEVISESQELLLQYKDIMKKYRRLKSLIIFTNIENESITYNSPEVLRMMKENNQFLVFDDLCNVKLFDCPMSLLRKYKKNLNNDEAYFLTGNVLKKVKTVLKR